MASIPCIIEKKPKPLLTYFVLFMQYLEKPDSEVQMLPGFCNSTSFQSQDSLQLKCSRNLKSRCFSNWIINIINIYEYFMIKSKFYKTNALTAHCRSQNYLSRYDLDSLIITLLWSHIPRDVPRHSGISGTIMLLYRKEWIISAILPKETRVCLYLKSDQCYNLLYQLHIY